MTPHPSDDDASPELVAALGRLFLRIARLRAAERAARAANDTAPPRAVASGDR